MDFSQQTQCKHNINDNIPIDDCLSLTQDTKFKETLKVSFNKSKESEYVKSEDSSVYSSEDEDEEASIFSNLIVRY